MKEREIRYSQVSGTVKKFNGDHGWIDLEEPIDNNNEIYFKKDDVQNQIILKQGQYVIFDVSQNDYGLIAINVTPIKKKFPALFFIMIFIVVIGLWLLFYSLFKSKLPWFSCRFSAYLIAINITTMVLYAYDKYISIYNEKHTGKDSKARISERSLHFFELLLGTPGAYLSQQLFKHKLNRSFQIIFERIVLFQMIICISTILFYLVYKNYLQYYFNIVN